MGKFFDKTDEAGKMTKIKGEKFGDVLRTMGFGLSNFRGHKIEREYSMEREYSISSQRGFGVFGRVVCAETPRQALDEYLKKYDIKDEISQTNATAFRFLVVDERKRTKTRFLAIVNGDNLKIEEGDDGVMTFCAEFTQEITFEVDTTKFTREEMKKINAYFKRHEPRHEPSEFPDYDIQKQMEYIVKNIPWKDPDLVSSDVCGSLNRIGVSVVKIEPPVCTSAYFAGNSAEGL